MRGDERRAIKALLSPQSVAIVGASPNFSSLQGMPLAYLLRLGYKGKIYPVNPKYPSINGLTCFSSISELPDEGIDVALILVPYRLIYDALEGCAQKGIKTVLIFSSGFAEVGGEGLERQKGLKDFVARTGVRLCGPNCVGIINMKEKVGISFTPVLGTNLISGSIGLVAHSGAIGGSIMNRALDQGIGFTYFASTGNEVDLEACDFMEYMLEDPQTKVVAGFIEGFKNPEKFLALTDLALEMEKPLVILKAGFSEKGARAALAHTGSLAGRDEVYEALFKQKGIIRAQSIDELINICYLLSHAPRSNGDRVGILTTSGGAASLFADECERLKLNLPDLPEGIREEAQKLLSFGTPLNPLDITGQVANEMGLFGHLMKLFLDDEAFDIVVLLVTNIFGELGLNLVEMVKEIGEQAQKPLLFICTTGSLADHCLSLLKDGPVPVFRTPEEGFRALRALVDYSLFLLKKKAHQVLAEPALAPSGAKEKALKLLKGKGRALNERESKELLSLYGIPCVREEVAKSLQEARESARRIGYPVALKVLSEDILHKTEAGAIRLNVQGEKELEEAFEEVVANARKYCPKAHIQGVLVQEMAKDGLETIVGMSQDAQCGPVILFGLGGTLVEALRDYSLRVTPLKAVDTEEMIQEPRASVLLDGFRGGVKRDKEALMEVLLKLSAMAEDLKEHIQEVDINPLFLFKEGHGARAGDALVVLKGGRKPF